MSGSPGGKGILTWRHSSSKGGKLGLIDYTEHSKNHGLYHLWIIKAAVTIGVEEVFADKSMINDMAEGEDKNDEGRIKETV